MKKLFFILLFVLILIKEIIAQPITYGTPDTGTFTNLTLNATLGSELAPALTEGNWTVGAGWESPIVGPGLIKNADGTGTQTTSAATTIVAGTTYKVVITLSALSVGTATYTVGGVTGTSLAAATTYTDYLTAVTTGKLIITPTNTSRFTISAVSIKALTDATGDLTVDGNLTVRSPSTFNSQVLLTDGTSTAPGLSFGNESTMGFYRTGSGDIAFGGGRLTFPADISGWEITSPGIYLTSSIRIDGNISFGNIAYLSYDAANTLALRNSTNLQTFNVYNTYTDASNHERLAITGVQGTSFNLTAQTAGTGGDNLNIVLTPAGTGKVVIPTITGSTQYLKVDTNGLISGAGALNSFSVTAAGTVATITNSNAALDFGTTDPVITLTTAGTYNLHFWVRLLTASATYVANQAASCQLYRTNNTPGAIAASTGDSTIPILTTTSLRLGSISVGPLIYTTTNTDDAITVYCILSASASAGSVTSDEANIRAIGLAQ